jgi:protease I
MAQTIETVPPERQGRPTESVPDIVSHIFELPFDAQLGVLRTIAPKILCRMAKDEISGYLRDLNDEIERAVRGEPTYDVRPKTPPVTSGRAVKRVAFIVDETFEDSELRQPLNRLRGAGHQVVIVGASAGKQLRGKSGKEVVTTDVAVGDVAEADFDALVIPGGYSPDHLRTNPKMVSLTRDFFDAGKPIAAICHAGSMLVEAGIVRGRTVTSWPSIKTDLVNAGASWVDYDVVVDRNLITSRKPADLPVFCDALLREVEGPLRERESPPPMPEAISAAPLRA